MKFVFFSASAVGGYKYFKQTHIRFTVISFTLLAHHIDHLKHLLVMLQAPLLLAPLWRKDGLSRIVLLQKVGWR